MENAIRIRPPGSPPFRLDLTVWALRRNPENTMDLWEGSAWRRAFNINGKIIGAAVSESGGRIIISVPAPLGPDRRKTLSATVKKILGFDAGLAGFYALADRDKILNTLAARFKGVRPPRFETPFEAAINAIACQQVSLNVGIMLLNRLTRKFGQSADGLYAFPAPAALAAAAPESIRALGFSTSKARSIIELAREVAGGLDLESRLSALEDGEAISELMRFRGIGRWSAEYILLRGLGRINLFPGDDVGAAARLREWLKIKRPLDYAGIRRVLSRWSPYAGFVYFHLLLLHLQELGYIR